MAWLTGWNYRKLITISRATGAVTNYQMQLLVGESSGAVGENVDCNSHIQTNFDDLRFTTSDGVTLLDYWIESITGVTPNRLATVWIEFDSIGTGATTFYMYYGKSGAPVVSSGVNTFIVFDDFERGIDGDAIGGSWTTAGTVTISTDHAYGGTRCMKLAGSAGTKPSAIIPVTATSLIAVRSRIWKEDLSAINYLCLWKAWASYTMILSTEKINYYDTAYREVGTAGKDLWELFENNNFDFTAHTFDMWYAGAKIKAGAIMSDWGVGSDSLRFLTFDAAGIDSYVDDVIVRNWRDTGPAWGSWGTEESAKSKRHGFVNFQNPGIV